MLIYVIYFTCYFNLFSENLFLTRFIYLIH